MALSLVTSLRELISGGEKRRKRKEQSLIKFSIMLKEQSLIKFSIMLTFQRNSSQGHLFVNKPSIVQHIEGGRNDEQIRFLTQVIITRILVFQMDKIKPQRFCSTTASNGFKEHKCNSTPDVISVAVAYTIFLRKIS